MKIELTKREIKTLRLALFYALEWEESFIDSILFSRPVIETINDQKTITAWKRHVPSDWKKDADRTKRNIKNFKKVLEKIKI